MSKSNTRRRGAGVPAKMVYDAARRGLGVLVIRHCCAGRGRTELNRTEEPRKAPANSHPN